VFYLIVQMWLWIILAALIGFVVGWLVRARFLSEKVDKLQDNLMMVRSARDRMEQDNKRLTARLAAYEASGAPMSQTLTQGEDLGEVTGAAGAIRPPALGAPRDGNADDLKQISGIGPKLEEVLNQLGIFHYEQIAAWTRQNVDWVDGYLRFKGRINREGWVEHARTLAEGKKSSLNDTGQAQTPA